MNPREYEIMYSVEEDYWWYAGMRRIVRRIFPEAFGLRRGRFLDAGCGTGANLAHVRSEAAGAFLAGLDLAPGALRLSIRRGLSNLVAGDITRLPYLSDAFDLVTCHDALYCVPDDVAGFRELFRVVKGGGRAFVSVAALGSLAGEHDLAVHAVRRYSARELRQKLEGAGFVVERLTFANSILLPPIYLVRLLSKLSRGSGRKAEATSDFDRSPGWLNSVLLRILYLEAFLLKFVDLPLGVTLMARARKPVQEAA